MKSSHALLLLGGSGFALGFFTHPAPVSASASHAPKSTERELTAGVRDHDPAKALEAMRILSEKDPRAFFAELGRFPALEGVAELAASAARKLSDQDREEAIAILNRISNQDLRRAAWTGFVDGLQGLTLHEKISVTRKADWNGVGLTWEAAVAPAMKGDLEGTLKALREEGDVDLYQWSLSRLSETAAPRVIQELKDSLEKGLLGKSDAQSIVGMMMAMPGNGVDLLKDLASVVDRRGWQGGVDFDGAFAATFGRVASGEKPGEIREVMEGIDLLPAVRKNLVLAKLDLASYPETETRAMILNAMDSAELQRAALEKWKAAGASAADLTALSPLLKSAKTRADLAVMSGR